MTTKEHALMIAIFTKNLQLVHSLKTLLESRGVIEKDDFKAYDTAIAIDAREARSVMESAAKIYVLAANRLGIEVPKDILESPLQ